MLLGMLEKKCVNQPLNSRAFRTKKEAKSLLLILFLDSTEKIKIARSNDIKVDIIPIIVVKSTSLIQLTV